MSFLLIRTGVAGGFASALGILGRRRSTVFEGRLAAISLRNADHTDFWMGAARRFPSDPRFLRKKVDAALSAGRIAEAEAAFALLLESGRTAIADCKTVVGLANVDARRGETARIRRRVRRYLATLAGRPDRRVAAVRLYRVIFAHFPRNPRRETRTGDLRRRFLAMLSRSQTADAPKALLTRAVACEERLERECPRCFFYTDVDRSEREEFVSLVHRKIALGQPFSFVRVGDGEAACLPYEPGLARHAEADAADRERIWWGEPLDRRVRNWLAACVARAIWDADCIGLPTIGRYLRELRLLQEDSLQTSLTGRGLRAVLYCSERLSQMRAAGLPPPVLASCHLHQDLALWNCYGTLFDCVSDVVLVSCHPDLADWVENKFGVRIARSVVVPPDRVSGPLLKRRVAEIRDLPHILDRVARELGDSPRGRLVLVGAGYPGKWLLSVARQRGGVALDVGSIFDYWLGLKTRSYLDLDPA